MIQINNDIVSKFLVDPGYRIYRHLLLLISVLIITINFVWYIPEEYAGHGIKLQALFFYTFIFLITISINYYIFVPRLLLKNKLLLYLFSILLCIFVIIAGILLIQEYLFEMDNNSEQHILSSEIINILSSIVVFMLFFMGTTAFSLFKSWIIYDQRIVELESSTLDSELKLLKSQINPHFLFNMLNNANIMVNEDPEVASRILVKLDDLLQYQINDSAKDRVKLINDILFLTDFLDLEKTRRDHFEYTIEREGNIEGVEVPPLLFIPFVENAVKHNPDSNNMSYVNIRFEIYNNKLTFTCANSKPLNPIKRDAGGLGLANIKRRLNLLYGKEYALQLDETETTYTVKLELKL